MKSNYDLYDFEDAVIQFIQKYDEYLWKKNHQIPNIGFIFLIY